MDVQAVVILTKRQFANAVRMIKNCRPDTAKQFRQATFTALKRLGVKRDPTKAVNGVPSGSDTFDARWLSDWSEKIQPEHKRAIRQLIALDATVVART